jgi:hypothetical protein
MEKITIEEASEQGLKHYFTGKPCKYGHISNRYLSNKECVTCRFNKTQEYKESGYFKNYRKQNTEKEQRYRKEYKKNNPDKINAITAKRRASKLQQTPNWLTEDEHWLIKEAYSVAKLREKTTNIKWHVDHVVPLQGDTVSGLHCPENLQVIPGAANCSKHNKWCWDTQS